MSQIIKTLLIHDDPNGVKIIEIEGWVGKVFLLPRGNIREVQDRKDIQQPGIYFLFGEGKDNPLVYIGQSEHFFDRLSSHESDENNWNIAVIFTGGLDSTYIKRLEGMAIDAAKSANRYELINQAIPQENIVSEIQQYAIQSYFEKIQFIMKFLGFTLFEEVPKETQAESRSSSVGPPCPPHFAITYRS